MKLRKLKKILKQHFPNEWNEYIKYWKLRTNLHYYNEEMDKLEIFLTKQMVYNFHIPIHFVTFWYGIQYCFCKGKNHLRISTRKYKRKDKPKFKLYNYYMADKLGYALWEKYYPELDKWKLQRVKIK